MKERNKYKNANTYPPHTHIHMRAAMHTNEWSVYECGVDSLRSARYTTIHKQ